jgi:hypothetical protein
VKGSVVVIRYNREYCNIAISPAVAQQAEQLCLVDEPSRLARLGRHLHIVAPPIGVAQLLGEARQLRRAEYGVAPPIKPTVNESVKLLIIRNSRQRLNGVFSP